MSAHQRMTRDEQDRMAAALARSKVAAAALGVSSSPSPSALAWSVAHAVAVECGRKPEDAMAIADRWGTVADMVGEAPPLDTTDALAALGLVAQEPITPVQLAERFPEPEPQRKCGGGKPVDTTHALDAERLVLDYESLMRRSRVAMFGVDMATQPDQTAAIRWTTGPGGQMLGYPITMDEFYAACDAEPYKQEPEYGRCVCGGNCRPGLCADKL